jgi:hypothetical protein
MFQKVDFFDCWFFIFFLTRHFLVRRLSAHFSVWETWHVPKSSALGSFHRPVCPPCFAMTCNTMFLGWLSPSHKTPKQSRTCQLMSMAEKLWKYRKKAAAACNGEASTRPTHQQTNTPTHQHTNTSAHLHPIQDWHDTVTQHTLHTQHVTLHRTPYPRQTPHTTKPTTDTAHHHTHDRHRTTPTADIPRQTPHHHTRQTPHTTEHTIHPHTTNTSHHTSTYHTT